MKTSPFAISRQWGFRPAATAQAAQASLTAAVWAFNLTRSSDLATQIDSNTFVLTACLHGCFQAITRVNGGIRYEGLRTPGQFSIIPPASKWDAHMPTGIIAATVHLYLGVDVVQQCWDDLSSAVGELGEIEAARNPEIERLVRAVAYEARAPGPASRVLLDSIALAAAVALRRYRNEQAHAADRSTAGMPLWRLKRVQNLIMSALDKDLSLAELAAASGYSISRFCHAFKNSTGISPHRYVMLQRVERASELLLQGKRNLAEVAAIVGFSDLSHMTHVMRRYADTTPKRLRKSVEITRLMLALQADDVERGRCLSAASSNLPKIDRNDKPT